MHRMTKAHWRAIVAFALVLGTIAAALGVFTRIADEPPYWPPYGLAFDLGVFGSFLAFGEYARQRRPDSRVGPLMIAVAFAYLPIVLSWSGWPVAATASFLLGQLAYGVLAHLYVSYPTGRLAGARDRRLVAGLYGLVAIAGIVDLGYPTVAPDCPVPCPNLLYIATWPDPESLRTPLAVAALIAGALVLGAVARHWRASSSAGRRAMTPTLAAAGIAVTAVGVTRLLNLTVGASLDLYVFAIPTALALMPVAFAIGVLRSQLDRGAVGDLLLSFDDIPEPAALQEAIARALRDPTARILFWRDDLHSYVDVNSRPTAIPESDAKQAVTLVGQAAAPVAAVVHDRTLLEDPRLVRSVAAAARLALENARLQDELRLSRELLPGLAERLQREGQRIGETKRLVITVLMSDIRGYTTLAEHSDPVALAGQLQEHRAAMATEISRRGGTVMQYVGDAVFAVFGAPEPLPDQETQALSAAAGMHVAQGLLDRQWAERGAPPFRIGIGLTTGPVAAALLGSADHLEYSVVGDVVNLCARIQQWADEDTVADETTYLSLDPRPAAERLEPAAVKGRTSLVVGYRITNSES